MTKIAVPFVLSELAALDAVDLAAFAGADIIEWRADGLPMSEIAAAAPRIMQKFKDFELCFTFRTEDKSVEISEENYVEILQIFANFGPNYLDIEPFTYPHAVEKIIPFSGKVLFSYHDFQGMPADLTDKIRQMQALKPDILKFAVRPHSESEVEQLLSLSAALSEPHILIGMGALGKPTRLDPHNVWTFAAVPGMQTAEGQLTIAEIQEFMQ